MSFIISAYLLLLINIPVYDAKVDYQKYYSECSKTATLKCGKTTLGPIYYPFWGEHIRPSYCGLEGFELSCKNNEIPVIAIGSKSEYRVVKIDPDVSAITLHRYDDHLVDDCTPVFNTTILNKKLFEYSQGVEDLYMFFGCPLHLHVPVTVGVRNNFTCKCGAKNKQVIFGVQSNLEDYLYKLRKQCQTPIRLPVQWTDFEIFSKNSRAPLKQILDSSFEIHYKINESTCHECRKYGGECWNGTDIGVHSRCLHKPGNSAGKKIRIAVGAAGGGMVLFLLVLLILYRRKKSKNGLSGISPIVSFSSFLMPQSTKEGAHTGVSTFSYSELEKATNYFHSGNELGKGGFGTVYKGKLRDGREVAVKRLYENNFKRVEQFMNEIVILAGLHHPHLVVLYGSTSNQCRKLLLVYEYIPNGTVADHLNEDGAEPGSLTWRTRLSIAIETASALSFGVVLIGLISSKPAVDISRHRHEINLANLAINKIQGDALHELVDPTLGFESDHEVRNMIEDVAELAFRCLQHEREMRPSMEEVHKSLKEIQEKY
ncbi:Protein kinase domain-containing protein [Heracleum sosnowskyi]|uniref:non-specific serine/threonine protein kinase n=1 Tax=Heracleum sosnowskyi TaxID=360622 RepID=A0AAD8IFK3_9APIA|nr:Protein kinase domain-containing protein [Heracleum sosnowskyi]